MIQHLTTEHSEIVNEGQVPTYADMCEREIDCTALDICLICSQQMSLSRLHDHLATHMEETALFVLPLTPDDEEDERIEEIHGDIDEQDEEDEQIREIAEDIDEQDEEDVPSIGIATYVDEYDYPIRETKTDQDTAEDTESLKPTDQYQQQSLEQQGRPSFLDFFHRSTREGESQEATQDATDDTDSLEATDQYQQQSMGQQALPSFLDLVHQATREGRSREAANNLLDPDIGSRSQHDIETALRPGKTEKKKEHSAFHASTSHIPQRDHILDLTNSERAANGGNDPTRTQKHPATFQCTLCPKKFTRAYNLRAHLRTHADERSYICTMCGAAFARQHDFKRHESLHPQRAVERNRENKPHDDEPPQEQEDVTDTI